MFNLKQFQTSDRPASQRQAGPSGTAPSTAEPVPVQIAVVSPDAPLANAAFAQVPAGDDAKPVLHYMNVGDYKLKGGLKLQITPSDVRIGFTEQSEAGIVGPVAGTCLVKRGDVACMISYAVATGPDADAVAAPPQPPVEPTDIPPAASIETSDIAPT